jgi:hypothetical protein
MNLVSFLCFQSTKRIELEIRNKHGDFYFNVLKNEMEKDSRFSDFFKKMLHALNLSRSRVIKYLN